MGRHPPQRDRRQPGRQRADRSRPGQGRGRRAGRLGCRWHSPLRNVGHIGHIARGVLVVRLSARRLVGGVDVAHPGHGLAPPARG
ncbi:hypothetical protein C1I98_38815, partial [Spongiactinospora gelatinilytica]